MATWFVYMLLCGEGSLYTGIAKDPMKRFGEHIAGRGGAYTRSHKPIKIVYVEPAKNHSEALIREAEIKRWSRTTKIHALKISL
ncbi:GIY-YIG nuclease family protein [Candidatus Gottesmanbacteria bacterium]|nr:GIY-YIG nuclease family protein [Candidatus Gottesmanbacteria bacterium]